MSTVTFRGVLAPTQQRRLHLSTNNGMMGYRIKKFQIISSAPMAQDVSLVMKIRLTEDDNVGATINFEDPSLVAVSTYEDTNSKELPNSQYIIFESEIFNQDIFVTCADADGNTTTANYYLELEKIKLDLNASTVSTLKNIRQDKADNL